MHLQRQVVLRTPGCQHRNEEQGHRCNATAGMDARYAMDTVTDICGATVISSAPFDFTESSLVLRSDETKNKAVAGRTCAGAGLVFRRPAFG